MLRQATPKTNQTKTKTNTHTQETKKLATLKSGWNFNFKHFFIFINGTTANIYKPCPKSASRYCLGRPLSLSFKCKALNPESHTYSFSEQNGIFYMCY